MKKFFVDRIEDNIVFCEDESGEEVKFNPSDVNGKVSAGDVVVKDENGIIQTDAEATLLRKKKISNSCGQTMNQSAHYPRSIRACAYLSSAAYTPGSSLPSRNSRDAPPPVEI